MPVAEPLRGVGVADDVVPGTGASAELEHVQREAGTEQEKRDAGEAAGEKLGGVADDLEPVSEHTTRPSPPMEHPECEHVVSSV